MSIVVTGATGQLGHLVVEKLLDRGIAPDEVVATGRDLDKVADLAARGVRTALLDYADPAAGGVLEAGDTLLLVSANTPGKRVEEHTAVIQAAAKAGVARIVYTSAARADDTTLVLAPEHAETERVLRDSGVPFTILRNGWYTENYQAAVEQAKATGEVVTSTGDGRVASATRADFAAAIAAVLSTDGHTDAVYELAGDEAWSFDEFAATLGDVLGRPVVHRRVTAQEHLEILRGAGLAEGTAQFVVALDTNTAEGTLALATGDLSRLAGRPTTPLHSALTAMAG